MNIRINDDYSLKSDPMNVIIEERVKKKNKDGVETEERWSRYRYYTDLKSACFGLLDRILKKDDAITVEQIIQAIEKAEQSITKAVESRGDQVESCL